MSDQSSREQTIAKLFAKIVREDDPLEGDGTIKRWLSEAFDAGQASRAAQITPPQEVTQCWKCSKTYGMSLSRCPHCNASPPAKVEPSMEEVERLITAYGQACINWAAKESDELDDLQEQARTALLTAIASLGGDRKDGHWVNPVLQEVERAVAKFPTWPTDPLHACGVVNEEVGELNKEVLQMVYEPHKTSKDAIAKEALQAAAMALRFYRSLDVYEYTKQPQHSQEN